MMSYKLKYTQCVFCTLFIIFGELKRSINVIHSTFMTKKLTQQVEYRCLLIFLSIVHGIHYNVYCVRGKILTYHANKYCS